MVQLYSADLNDVAQPVKKTVRKRKLKDEPQSPPPTEASEVSETAAPVPDVPTPAPEQPPKKKEKSEKQLAALERAREKRRLQKEEQERAKAEALHAELAAKAAKQAKLDAAREKRRLAKEAKLREQGVDPTLLPPQKGQVVKISRSRPIHEEREEPPAWFKKYVESVKTEQSKLSLEKKAQKVIKEEAHEEAKTHWEDKPTRSRVTHEVDNHMNRMYSMIFGQRRSMNA